MIRIMRIVETNVEETAELLGIQLADYRHYLGWVCCEHDMSDGAIENGGLEGYLEPEELDEYHRIKSLVRERNLLQRVNEDLQILELDQNGQVQKKYSLNPHYLSES